MPKIDKNINTSTTDKFSCMPDENGHFGLFGGRFVSETLILMTQLLKIILLTFHQIARSFKNIFGRLKRINYILKELIIMDNVKLPINIRGRELSILLNGTFSKRQ